MGSFVKTPPPTSPITTQPSNSNMIKLNAPPSSTIRKNSLINTSSPTNFNPNIQTSPNILTGLSNNQQSLGNNRAISAPEVKVVTKEQPLLPASNTMAIPKIPEFNSSISPVIPVLPNSLPNSFVIPTAPSNKKSLPIGAHHHNAEIAEMRLI